MSTGTMRDLLLRVQTDADLADRVRAQPETLAATYGLTEREVDVLRRCDASLYAYLVPAHRLRAGLPASAEANTLVMEGEPAPDPVLPPLVAPDTTLPEPLSNLPLTFHPGSPAPLQNPDPDLDPGPENPDPEVVPEQDDPGWGAAARIRALVAEIKSSTGSERRENLVRLMAEIER